MVSKGVIINSKRVPFVARHAAHSGLGSQGLFLSIPAIISSMPLMPPPSESRGAAPLPSFHLNRVLGRNEELVYRFYNHINVSFRIDF